MDKTKDEIKAIEAAITSNFQSSLNLNDAHVQSWIEQLDAMEPMALLERVRMAEIDSFCNAWDYWQANDDKDQQIDRNNQAHQRADDIAIDAAVDVAIVDNEKETVGQRRVRYLELFNEEKRLNKRGALQRVFERERKQNPKADRSAIGKDIAKARGNAKAQKQENNWTSQLVTNGKRKG